MRALFALLCLVVASSFAAVVTIAISQSTLPARIIVAPFDTLHFVNIDKTRVHRLSAPALPGFESQDLYPLSFSSEKALSHAFIYELNGAAEGEYVYSDEYTRTMRGIIQVLDYTKMPWDLHPGYPGPLANAGPTRIIGARVKPTRLNALNEISPLSQERVVVEVALAGAGNATLLAKLRGPDFALGPACVDGVAAPPRAVDAYAKNVEEFLINAASLPDGSLSFELELNGETYIVPGPVNKATRDAAFPNGATKTIVNINLNA